MGYLSHLSFFQTGIWVPILLDILDTCPFFNIFSLSFMNNFCIAPFFFFCNWNFQERFLQELRAFILTIIFCVYSLCWSRTFLGGWKTYCSVLPVWEHQVYVECTWSWSWEHDKFLNKSHKVWLNSTPWQVVYVEGFPSLYIMYGSGRTLLTTMERCNYSFYFLK